MSVLRYCCFRWLVCDRALAFEPSRPLACIMMLVWLIYVVELCSGIFPWVPDLDRTHLRAWLVYGQIGGVTPILPTRYLDFDALKEHKILKGRADNFTYNLLFNQSHVVDIYFPAPALFDYHNKERYFVLRAEPELTKQQCWRHDMLRPPHREPPWATTLTTTLQATDSLPS